MGISANQARFLSLTSRQIDLEKRIQDICQRRMRLSTQLENIATAYNNAISNRKMFTSTQTNGGIQTLSVANLEALGYKVVNTKSNQIVGTKPPSPQPSDAIQITSQEQFLQIVNNMNTNGVGLDKNYVLDCNIDLSGYDTGGKALIQGAFSGSFDGNCYQISGLNIKNTDPSTNPTGSYFGCGSGDPGVGLFEILNGATVSNLDLSNANIAVNGNTERAGVLAGTINNSTVSNINVSKSTVSGSTDSKGLGGLAGVLTGDSAVVSGCTVDAAVTGAWSVGGIVGLMNGGVLEKSESLGSATINQATMRTDDGHTWDRMAGGIAGVMGGGTVSQCYSDANVSNIANYSGGIAGMIAGVGTVVENSYTNGSISASGGAGGIAGDIRDSAVVTNCYTQATSTAPSQSGGVFGARGWPTPGTISNTFYDSTMYPGGFGLPTDAAYWTNVAGISTADINNHAGSFATTTSSWDSTNVWDFSKGAPTLRGIGYQSFGANLEDNLRNGLYTLAKPADEFSQETVSIGGNKYEKVDWRTAPELYDELFGADDEDAENKYDKATAEINAQDKKLQLEDASIEVEYKEVTSEKEAVKKILDTNSQSSFKYFS